MNVQMHVYMQTSMEIVPLVLYRKANISFKAYWPKPSLYLLCTWTRMDLVLVLSADQIYMLFSVILDHSSIFWVNFHLFQECYFFFLQLLTQIHTSLAFCETWAEGKQHYCSFDRSIKFNIHFIVISYLKKSVDQKANVKTTYLQNSQYTIYIQTNIMLLIF